MRLPATALAAGLCAVVLAAVLIAAAAGAETPPKILGPDVCGECHKQEVVAWKESHHFTTFREMPRKKRAKEIAANMGIRRIKSESLCLGCHYTVREKKDKRKSIAGISCESCHGPGLDWIKIHSGFSGKTATTETRAEEAARWKLADAKGMIRPHAVYELARNCYGCHVVPHEDLVNTGGHRAGSDFELVSWSQGEVRHTTWHAKGSANVPATPARRRVLYLVGLGVELETSLRALGKATGRKVYAFEMAARVDRARRKLSAAAAALPDMPEIGTLVATAHWAPLSLRNEAALSAAADAVARIVEGISDSHDGERLKPLDRFIPGPEKYMGRATIPGPAR